MDGKLLLYTCRDVQEGLPSDMSYYMYKAHGDFLLACFTMQPVCLKGCFDKMYYK